MIIDWIIHQANKHPEHIAVQTIEEKVKYRDFLRNIEDTALQMYQLCPVKNGTIAIAFQENRLEFLTYFLGATRMGWKVVPVDPKLKVDQIQDILMECCPDILITEGRSEITKRWTGKVIYINDVTKGIHTRNLSLPSPTPESVFYLGYTSGTSGKPKGFVRTQRSWTESFRNTDEEYKLHEDCSVIIPGSLVHSLFLYGTLHALSVGSSVQLMDSFSSDGIAERINPNVKTILYVVPTMLETLLNEPKNQWGHVDLIISSGSKLNKDRRNWVEKMFSNAECIEFYGASELSFVSILHHQEAHDKLNSVGRPFTGVEVSIRDDAFMEVETGEVGTLYVKSSMIFKEYYQLPDETKRVFTAGWATVGDLARMDDEGYLYLVGRANQMIISGGLNVFPEEVERVILSDPSVETCAIIGLPDTYWGERIVAVIKWRDSEGNEEQKIHDLCVNELPTYKCPKEYITTSQFPYTISGKIARKQLIEQIIGR